MAMFVEVDVGVEVGEPLVVVLLASSGLCAPQGFCSLQLLAQMLLLPQAFTHWLPHSVQTKYGSVSVYSETFGCWLLPQIHPYVRVTWDYKLAMGSLRASKGSNLQGHTR
jgi:hypothetical protein